MHHATHEWSLSVGNHTYEYVMFKIWKWNMSHMNEACLICITHIYDYVMSIIWKWHMLHTNEACLISSMCIYICIFIYIYTHNVDASCHTWMRHVSCQTCVYIYVYMLRKFRVGPCMWHACSVLQCDAVCCSALVLTPIYEACVFLALRFAATIWGGYD